MMKISYCVICERYTSKDKKCYGVAVIIENDGVNNIIKLIPNITTDYKKVRHLVELCNELKLDSVHLENVIEDFMF